MMNPRRFLAELKRRNVYKVAVAYVVAGWALAQGIAQVFPVFDIPNWIVRLIVLLIVIGFPIALVIAWAFELTPEGLRRTEDADAIALPRARRHTWIYVVAFAGAVSIGLFFLGRYTASNQIEVPELLQKSIAVLPFQNFSEEKANAYFADGIQNEILINLAKIKDLWVISRTSVMQYKSEAPRNVREIGQQLGVTHLLEGSVQRSGNRVRVTAQLIDARSDSQQWAERYDRDLADVFAIQSEIAKAIADQLKAKLSPQEKARVEETPTANTEAYEFYLRANQIERNPDTLLQDYKTAEGLFDQAIELDPNFALAHARLASIQAEIFHYYEPTESRRTKARTEAETALRLEPNLAEAHFALGQCIYWIDRDYERALEQFEFASRLAPSNGDARRLIAAIRRREGKWEEALEAYERVAKLDPQNPNTVRELMFTNIAMRRWPEAAQWGERMRAMAPASLVAKVQSGYVDFWRNGDTHLLKLLVDQVPAGIDPDGAVTAARWEVAMLRRDYSAAKSVLKTSTVNELSYTTAGTTPKIFFEGCIYLAQGDRVNAQKAFELARPEFEAAVKEAPASAERHAVLGWLYAFMGRKDDAVREGQRAVELKPESKDAVDGTLMNGYLALIYARVGESDLAIPLIERLLKIPGAVDSADYSITINDLKYRWEWDPIRNDSRFQELIAEKKL
jgi:TolB-like protein/Tfp pilus assembly protein PilF